MANRNVTLWILNDEGLYRTALAFTRRYHRPLAARLMLDVLVEAGITHTPDGAKYTVTAIRAAMVGL